jgi:hypothetical protein
MRDDAAAGSNRTRSRPPAAPMVATTTLSLSRRGKVWNTAHAPDQCREPIVLMPGRGRKGGYPERRSQFKEPTREHTISDHVPLRHLDGERGAAPRVGHRIFSDCTAAMRPRAGFETAAGFDCWPDPPSLFACGHHAPASPRVQTLVRMTGERVKRPAAPCALRQTRDILATER